MGKTPELESNRKMTTELLFKLLPVQILLSIIGSVNGIVSGIFASNFIGETAMSAVGLYGPFNMLIGAISTMLVTGAVVICGKYMGKNQVDQMQNVFSLDMILSTLVALVITAVILSMGIFDLTGAMAKDPQVRQVFNQYLMGQTLGVFPFLIGNQLSSFLSLENKAFRTTVASIAYILANLLFNFLFIQVLHMEALGLALASAFGMWVFMLVQAQYFFSGKSALKLKLSGLKWGDGGEIARIGVPGAITYGYQTVRGFIVNALILTYVGSVGLSAFAASDAILRFFWSVPGGMLAVSRMMISVSVGEEDRTTLTNVMRIALFRFIPLQSAISLFIILMARPFTLIFYQDVTSEVYQMTLWGFRIIPLCMPLSTILMFFNCYALASGRQYLVHIYGFLDGVLNVALFSFLLVPVIGMNGVYIANVLNGVVTTVVVIVYACIMKKGFPVNMDELMVIPHDFGVDDDHRLELTVHNIEDVTGMSEQVQKFCADRGVDKRRAYFTGLSLEEMAGNVVKHGFSMDGRRHNLSARAIVKADDVILCIKDDCKPFDPVQRQRIADPEDKTSNIGLRMIYKIAKDFNYQNVLGLNVLTIKL